MRKIVLLFVFFISIVSFSQEKETDKLLKETSAIVFHKPNQALKVSKHILLNANNNLEKADALLLSATAYYVNGSYDSCLTNAFLTRELVNDQNVSYTKSTILIVEILDLLKLEKEAKNYYQSINFKKFPELKNVQNYIDNPYKSFAYLEQNNQNPKLQNLDEIQFIKQSIYNRIINLYIHKKEFSKAQNFLDKVSKSIEGNYWKSLADTKQSEIFFYQHENKKAINLLNKTSQIISENKNPFVELEIYRNTASNYLVLDNFNQYHLYNQKALKLIDTKNKVENNTTNLAYQLINKEAENILKKEKRQTYKWSIIITSIVFLLLSIKTLLFLRNRNKLKTYTLLLEYLSFSENQKQKTPNIKTEESKPNTILKESENQILLGLQKFETSKRFTNKDMSLGLLASQLNTNTKYLSQVIKNHKQKNFKTYINDLRINYIVEKIKTEPNYLNYKVSYLAQECGFSSHSTFTTVFKSILGVSPIEFVELVKEKVNLEN